MDTSVVAGHRKRSADHAASADKLKAAGGVQEWEIVMIPKSVFYLAPGHR